MDRRAKNLTALFLLVALLAAVLLSSSLPNLTLQGASPFPGAGGQTAYEPAPSADRAVASATSWSVLSGVLAGALVVLTLYLLVRLLTFTSIKRLVGVVIASAVILVLILSLPRVPTGGPLPLPPESIGADRSSTDYPTSPLGSPPPQLVLIVGIVVAIGLGVLAAATLGRRSSRPSASAALLQQAEAAVQDLEAGLDSTEVVVRCYLQMTSVLRRERGVERDRSLTVREFETALETLALPRPSLRRLRALFEAVRYGNRTLDAEEEQAAMESLNQIVSALRATA